jgi:hypothetical protein
MSEVYDVGIFAFLLITFGAFYALGYWLWHSVSGGLLFGVGAVVLLIILSEAIWNRTVGRG